MTPIKLSALALALLAVRLELLGVRLEELARLLQIRARDGLEGQRRHVVRLALAHQRVVLEQVLPLRLVAVRLAAQHAPGFASVCF